MFNCVYKISVTAKVDDNQNESLTTGSCSPEVNNRNSNLFERFSVWMWLDPEEFIFHLNVDLNHKYRLKYKLTEVEAAGCAKRLDPKLLTEKKEDTP